MTFDTASLPLYHALLIFQRGRAGGVICLLVGKGAAVVWVVGGGEAMPEGFPVTLAGCSVRCSPVFCS